MLQPNRQIQAGDTAVAVGINTRTSGDVANKLRLGPPLADHAPISTEMSFCLTVLGRDQFQSAEGIIAGRGEASAQEAKHPFPSGQGSTDDKVTWSLGRRNHGNLCGEVWDVTRSRAIADGLAISVWREYGQRRTLIVPFIRRGDACLVQQQQPTSTIFLPVLPIPTARHFPFVRSIASPRTCTSIFSPIFSLGARLMSKPFWMSLKSRR